MSKIKQSLIHLYSLLNLDRLFLRKTPRVLFYHGVAANIVDAQIETESISAADFERQLQYITKHFKPVSIDEFYRKLKDKTFDGDEILLTFDDGYRNMLTTALPLLEKYDVPFALFLTVENIDKGMLFPTTINRLVTLASTVQSGSGDMLKNARYLKSRPINQVEVLLGQLESMISKDEMEALRRRYASIEPLTWDEVRVIAQSPLCTIGSHCMTHICCHGRQPISEVIRQFGESRRILSEKLNRACDYLSYPNGSFTPEVEEVAKQSGYKMAFSTRYEAVDSEKAMAIGRIYVPYNYARFKYAISRYR